MGNMFDEHDRVREKGIGPRLPAPAQVPAPPISGNMYDAPPAGPALVNGVDWSRYNQPWGELKPRSMSPTEHATSAGQDALIGLGMDPYRAAKVAEGLTSVARLHPAVNAVSSGADLPYHLSQGEYLKAGLDTLGLIPGVHALRRYVSGMPKVDVAAIPEIPEVYKASTDAYKRIAANPTEFHPLSLNQFIRNTTNELGQTGSHGTPHTPQNSPEFYDLLRNWWNNGTATNPGPNLRAGDLEAFRQQLMALPWGPSGVAGRKTADRLGNFMRAPPPGAVIGTPNAFVGTPPPGSVTSGPTAALAALRRDIDLARGNWRSAATADTIDTRLTDAQRAATSRGGNPGEATIGALNRLANTERGRNAIFGATPAQRDLIAQGAQSRPAISSWLADKLGGGWAAALGSNAAGAGALAAGADPWTIAGAGAVGLGIPKAASLPFSSYATNNMLRTGENVVKDVLKSSPLYQQRAALAPPITDPNAMMRDAIAYAMTPQIQDAGKAGVDQLFAQPPDTSQPIPRIYVSPNREEPQ